MPPPCPPPEPSPSSPSSSGPAFAAYPHLAAFLRGAPPPQVDAFWVAVGIPVSMLATLAAMALMGQSINMVSLFAMIMAIGIIVDDAIVVGEHSVTRRAAGDSPTRAAETGASSTMIWASSRCQPRGRTISVTISSPRA